MPIWLCVVIGIVVMVIGGLLFRIGLLLDELHKDGAKAGVPGIILAVVGLIVFTVGVVGAAFHTDWGVIIG